MIEMNGKTHDLQEKKIDIRFYYAYCAIFFIGGAGMLISAFVINDLPAYLVLGGIGIALLVIGLYFIKKIKQMDRFIAYGIDEDRGVIWSGVFQEGQRLPIETVDIPISSVRTVLLAPHLLYYTHKQSHTTVTTYFYVPTVLIVFEKNGTFLYSQVNFNEDEGANEWLTKAQQADLPLYWTDEAVNNVYKEHNVPELIETDIHKERLNFNGSVNQYINRKRKEDYKYFPDYKKGEARELDHDAFVTFKWGLKPIFFITTLLLLTTYSIEHWFVTSSSNLYSGGVHVAGIIISTLLLSVGHLLYSYSQKRFRVRNAFAVLGLSVASYMIASIATSLIIQAPQPHDGEMNLLLWYLFFFLPLTFVAVLIRKWKPAEHHFNVQQQKERLRYAE